MTDTHWGRRRGRRSMIRAPSPMSSERSVALQSLASTILGGFVGWTAFLSGLDLWGLLIGAASTSIAMITLGHTRRSQRPFSVMAAYALAFALLTWPVLGIFVAIAWSGITGQALGD
jgi:hypothetical protein